MTTGTAPPDRAPAGPGAGGRGPADTAATRLRRRAAGAVGAVAASVLLSVTGLAVELHHLALGRRLVDAAPVTGDELTFADSLDVVLGGAAAAVLVAVVVLFLAWLHHAATLATRLPADRRTPAAAWWWGAWIVSHGGHGAVRLLVSSDTPEDYVRSAQAFAAGHVLDAVTGVLAVLAVLSVTRRLQAHLGAGPAPPAAAV